MNRNQETVTNRYSLPTRIGRWNDDLALWEAEEKLNIYKKVNNRMLAPKLKDMLETVLEPTALTTAVDDIIYGRVYQIVAPEVRSIVQADNGLILSGIINEKQVEVSNTFLNGSTVTASPHTTPCRRNSFLMASAEGKSGTITYGDEILFQLLRPPGLPALYLQAESSNYDTFGDLIYAQLSDYPDVYCHFKILDRRPKMRVVSLGSKVVPNTNVIIRHVPSGQNLAVEVSKWIPTFYGAECTVSCHNYQDKNRIETAENVWRIVGRKDSGEILKK